MENNYVIKNNQEKYLGKDTNWTYDLRQATKGSLGEMWRTAINLNLKDYVVTLENGFQAERVSHRYQLYNGLREYFGIEQQLIVAIEELSELQKEITKYLRGKGNRDNMIEEIADTEIILEQLKMYNDIFIEIEEKKSEKIDRTYRRSLMEGVEI